MSEAEHEPGYLAGNEPEVINSHSTWLILGLIASAVVGGVLDKTVCKKYSERSREPVWVLLLVVVSYAYLIPGLVEVLFSFNIVFDTGPGGYYGIGPEGGFNQSPPTTETMLGLVKLLHDTGSDLGAVLVVFYAIFIPVLKLCLLILGHIFQLQACDHRRTSRRCIQVVQNISKWACPDMFAYILLMHLVRSLSRPPYLKANGRLDLGFTCFSLFCIGSTVASLGIRVPDREHGCFQKLGRYLREKRLIYVTSFLFVVFCVFFFWGLNESVMTLKVANLEGMVAQVLAWVGLTPEMLQSEVSVFSLMLKLAQESGEGKVTSLIGFVMFCVFVVGMTILNMVVLMATSVFVFQQKSGSRLMQLSWVLKKLSMVDVMCMGVLIVTLCMAMYRENVVVNMGLGQWLLVTAEVLHYFTYYTVKGVIEVTEKVDLGNTTKGDEESDISSDSSSEEPEPESEGVSC
mmetsp:Transcript_119236/g.282998  ORF Transcript_119236/g.282998 Transcript_119236/m.282998 type:complete len:460 (+) Transcript_119236:55-1434(+)